MVVREMVCGGKRDGVWWLEGWCVVVRGMVCGG